ncbi:MAG: hypothetical protein ABH824_07030 [Nanoarchaeota archaeon]|nr:hypothetical protein [Nanoarchaeota archaeon]MBU1632373.1 hypothetical protein [Nanoarchaeota archaeon]MBU1875830.1 hypothetical protein [Nanoarchaeota archaeon]
MKKSVLKSFVVISLIFSLLFVVSCKPNVAAGEKPIDTAAALQLVKTGTLGVEISLLQNSPPALIYDQNELVALVEVKNRGNHDLDAQDCFIQISGFDTNIISGGFNIPRSCSENAGTLEGKNVYNTEGSSNLLEFTANAYLPPGVLDYNPTLNFLTCYNYHTTANPPVCIDPLFYQITSEQKSCIPKDVGMAGGQGGTVGVSYVGVDMIGDKAIFEINVRNFGTGRILSPYSDIGNCGQALEYKDLDRVGYTVQMSGGSLIDCKPQDGLVRLNNNQGKIVCSFNIPGTSAFETPLMIDLDYSYVQSFQRPVRIVKTPQ